MRALWCGLFLLVPFFGVGSFVYSAYRPGGWLPENISTGGHGIDTLFYIILTVTGIIFVITEILLVYAMWTGRGDDQGKANYYHGHNILEITWTLATAAILLFIAFYQMPIWAKAKYYGSRPKKDPDCLVEASQFLWQIRYPCTKSDGSPSVLKTVNPDLSQSFELINELHTYPGEPILIHLRTRDVIHSFWLPELRVKQDALPGHLSPVWFQVDRDALTDAHKIKVTATNAPGAKEYEVFQYEWVCAELCGWGHFRMHAKLYVHPSKQDYLAWLREKSANVTKNQ